jgi:hypothetical protein
MQHVTALDTLVGLCFLVVGTLKLALSILSFSLSSEALARLKRTPVLSWLLPPDKTFAGLAFDSALCVFGLYSILHGLSLMGVWGRIRLVDDWRFKFGLFTVLGVYLFVVYYLAIFTNVHVSKVAADRWDYLRTGFALAIFFFFAAAFVLVTRGRWHYL